MWTALGGALERSGRSVRLDIAVSRRLPNLGGYVRDIYRLHFGHELAAGTVRPLVIPYALLGTIVLPVLYFSVPHVGRPWLYRARYLLWLFILAFNMHSARTSSSDNFAVGFVIGLMHAWGILWSMTLLIWTSPQFEAERVEKRKRATPPVANGTAAAGSPAPDGGAEEKQQTIPRLQANGRHPGALTEGKRRPAGPAARPVAAAAPDEDVARSISQGYEYYWQAYPAGAPFLARLGWSWDLVTSFRGTGWNWTVPIIPHFAGPETPLAGCPVDTGSIPLRTRQGFRRHATRRSLVRARLASVLLGYLVLDLLTVLMRRDPYFILGPEFASEGATIPATTISSWWASASTTGDSNHNQNALSLPPLLAALPAWLLLTYRAVLCFSAIITAVDVIMSLWHLTCTTLLRGPHLGLDILPGTRAELWHYPSTYGSFAANVLDKGLAGFWGGWWHQTFRVAFSAPSSPSSPLMLLLASSSSSSSSSSSPSLLEPHSPPGRALAGLLAFAQSAFLHALGSVSCLPPSRPWAPPVFFMLSWVGILVQAAACAAARPLTNRLPRSVRRAGNLLFVFAWLVATQYWFCDDVARAGIWLLEPVPVSPLRAVGLGARGDEAWWRWERVLRPRWYSGQHWWESGVAI
ncbi:hypothetical protein VPNG_09185 [Cytospora leucostoma]|uniref:Wax synthase domain-containing protein n=1 Tax=Cytospora leucostoma TaxID=1230097 RepID=A0A423VUH7_9PEZI|nr:hypothetical protein VPNG_09185 [Cytospora leucostoma]